LDIFDTDKQRFAYVNALVHIAALDQVVTEAEREYIVGIANKFGISDNAFVDQIMWSLLAKRPTIEEIVIPINEKRQKLSLIHDLIVLCFADGEYSEVERKMVKRVCMLLQISDEELKSIEEINCEFLLLTNKLAKFLEVC